MGNHSYYEPTNEFIERHGLHVSEAETWAELSDSPETGKDKRSISYNKDSGHIVLWQRTGDDLDDAQVLFNGYLPNGAALESVIAWTKWAE